MSIWERLDCFRLYSVWEENRVPEDLTQKEVP